MELQSNDEGMVEEITPVAPKVDSTTLFHELPSYIEDEEGMQMPTLATVLE